MDKTPLKSAVKLPNGSYGTPFKIPLSPFMEKLGYGTGVDVFRFRRNKTEDKLNFDSPWAVKSVSRRVCATNNDKQLFDERLAEEAKLLRVLIHPNIVGFRAFKKSNDGRDCLAMEDCNKSLGDMLEEQYEQQIPLLPQNIKKFILDISSALDYLHTVALLLHGDIKSFNVLIKGDFEICKLCDFGVSQPVCPDGFIDKIKKPNACYIGTSLWSAPEVLTEVSENVSTKADIFSFGMVIYETITLQPPHTINNFDENEEGISINSDSFDVESGYNLGTRPTIPEDIEITEDHNQIMEIFFVCTNEDPESRPTAKIILDLLKSK